jgi:hypothetical protein
MNKETKNKEKDNMTQINSANREKNYLELRARNN